MKIRSLVSHQIVKRLMLSLILLSLVACSRQAPTSSKSLDPIVINENAEYLTRDIKEDVFYLVVPDRFHNANPDNDNGDANHPNTFGGLNKTSKWAFHGGDILGVETKLDYIQNMGITAIWMTPLLHNRAIQSDGFDHPSYRIIDFTEIDPHFGTNEDLRSLIDAAHARDIKVFFDIITKHTADVIRYKECHNADGTFIKTQLGCKYKSTGRVANDLTSAPLRLEPQKAVKFSEWLSDPSYYNNPGDGFWQRESTINGDFAGLDDLKTSDPKVVAGMTQIFKNIIDEFKPDGFRIDTVKHVDLRFWQRFGPAIIAHAKTVGIPKFHIFGEVYDGNPAVLSKFTTAGKLPSVLDFGFHFNVKDSLFENKDVNRLGQLFDNDDYYRDADSAPNSLMNFLSNHDAGRVGWFIKQGFKNISEAEKLQRSVLGHAFMFMSRGIPVVYYGDEQGFTGGGGDTDAREYIDASLVDAYKHNALIGTRQTTADNNFNQRHPIYQSLQKFARLRAEHKALQTGVHQNRLIDNVNRIVAFSRIDANEKIEYLAIFNMGMQTRNISIKVDSLSYSSVFGNNAKVQQGQLTTTLEPLSFVLLKAQQTHKGGEIFDIVMPGVYIDNARLFVPINLIFGEQKALPFAEVDFYLIDKAGRELFIATDDTQPYRAVLMPDGIQSMQQLKVVVRDGVGNEMSKHFSF
jgi:glycosidase